MYVVALKMVLKMDHAATLFTKWIFFGILAADSSLNIHIRHF
jgi:hypothetical protein